MWSLIIEIFVSLKILDIHIFNKRLYFIYQQNYNLKKTINKNYRKKSILIRYIGNDSIHIVWNENIRPYKPGIISSQYNFVHIIINPIDKNLFFI